MCSMSVGIIISLCCLITVIFLIRLGRGAFSSTSVTWLPRRLPVSMVTVPNPFLFKINNIKSSSLSGVECLVSSQIRWIVQAFWGVSISKLFEVLNSDWRYLRNEMLENRLLQNCCISKSDLRSEEICENMSMAFAPPRIISGSELGKETRMTYPLVVLMVQESEERNYGGNCVVALINIVHLKDEVCTLETHVISQYLKHSNGPLFHYQPLYSPSSGDANQCEDESDLCVVCQTCAVYLAFLPCRHACVCYTCFRKLDKCPMCREVIQYYFALSPEREIGDNSDSYIEETEVFWGSLSWGQRFEYMNERLNQWLGFHE